MNTKIQTIESAMNQYCKMFAIDKTEALRVYTELKQYYGGTKIERNHEISKLETKWYSALDDEGYADYSVYDNEFYFCDLLACFFVYSHKCITMLDKLKIQPKSILDMGCGLGLTTQMLSDKYNANCIGTNLEETKQYLFAKSNGLDIQPDHKKVGQVDLVFASEYFEHIHNAGDHLLEVLKFNRPKYLIMANAFTAESVGHFRHFYNGAWASKSHSCDSMVPASKMGRMFSSILKAEGYSKMDAKFWNNRPQCWEKLK